MSVYLPGASTLELCLLTSWMFIALSESISPLLDASLSCWVL